MSKSLYLISSGLDAYIIFTGLPLITRVEFTSSTLTVPSNGP